MRLTEFIHHCLEAHLISGSRVLDATAGNGYDTLKCAQLVAPEGAVTAVDIQAIALENCQKKLADAQLDHLCQFIRGNHARIFEHLQPPQPYDAILFSLGYLPGIDHACITTAENTLRALNACERLLADDGLLIITAYRGHPVGRLKPRRSQNGCENKRLGTAIPAGLCNSSVLGKSKMGNVPKPKPKPNPKPNPKPKPKTPLTWIASKKPLNLPKIPLHSATF